MSHSYQVKEYLVMSNLIFKIIVCRKIVVSVFGCKNKKVMKFFANVEM